MLDRSSSLFSTRCVAGERDWREWTSRFPRGGTCDLPEQSVRCYTARDSTRVRALPGFILYTPRAVVISPGDDPGTSTSKHGKGLLKRGPAVVMGAYTFGLLWQLSFFSQS